MQHIYDSLVLASNDPWMQMITIMGGTWACVVAATLYKERTPATSSGAASDPEFLDKITEYHNEI